MTQTPETQPKTAEARLAEALALREGGDLVGAVGRLREILAEEAGFVRGWMELGRTLRRLGEREGALGAFGEAEGLEPEHLQSRIEGAIALRELKRLPEAQKKLETILETKPNQPDALFQLGEVYRCQQLYTEAIAQYKKTLILKPEHPWAALQIGIAQRESSQWMAAQQQFEAILQEHPEHFFALMQLGHLEQRQGNREQAIQWFRKAVPQAPEPKYALQAELLIAAELRELGHLEKAEQEVLRILARSPCHQQAKMTLARIFYLQFKFAAATEIYNSILEQDPDCLEAQLKQIKILSETHRVKEAIALLQNTEQQLPDAVEILLKLAHLKLRLGCPQECETVLLKLQEKFPKHHAIASLRSWLYLQTGRFQELVELLDLGNLTDRGWRKHRAQMLGEIALREYRFKVAEQHWREAIAFKPTSPHEYIRLSQALMMQGHLEEAYEQLKLGTEELKIRKSPEISYIPLKNNIVMVIDYLRLNPPLLEKMQQIYQEQGMSRNQMLAGVIAEEPAYVGASLYLAMSLRQQGVFAKLRQSFERVGNRSSKAVSGMDQIPRRIIQFWDSGSPPAEMQRLMSSWLEQNPGYEYVRFSTRSAIAFIRKYCDEETLKAFRLCEHPANQSDLFRLIYLSRMGGFYADADDRCLASLEPLVASGAELVVYQEEYAIGNNFMGCVPGQEAIRLALAQAIESLLEYSAESPWFKTGPGLVTSCICSTLLPFLSCGDYRVWPRLAILTLEELRSYVWPHVELPYKNTRRSWHRVAYGNRK